MKTALVLTTLLLLAAPAWADVTAHSTESRSFPGGHLVIVDNINGSIESTSYNGNDVQVEVGKEIEAESPERLEAAKREVKLDMAQSGDTVKLYVDGPFRCHCGDGSSAIHSHHEGYTVRYNFKLRVPASARLDLHTVNRGDIVVHGVGDFDLHNVNGRIEVTDATGTGTAHTVNGEIKATFARNPAGAGSFETVNGPVDITFRRGLAADVRLNTMHGGMYTDFEVSQLPSAPQEGSKQNGRYVFRGGGATGLRIGAGGPQIKIKTLNGDIFLRNRDK